MREYDETTLKVAKRVLIRSDEIVRQRQIKATKIRHISYAVTGLCAAVLLCFGLFNLDKYIKEPNPNIHDNYHNTTTDSNFNNKITTTSTTTTTVTSTFLTTTTTSTTTSDKITTSDIEESSEQVETTETPIDTTEEIEITTTESAPKTTTTKTVIKTTTAKPVTTKTTKTVVKPTLCGDVNGDNKIDIDDCSIIKGYVERKDGITWADYYKNYNKLGSKLSAEQALANADTFKASDKRELTMDDAKAILGHINGLYPNLPINELVDDD